MVETLDQIAASSLLSRFHDDVLKNRFNRIILERWDDLALPDSWLVAGCLFQTIWNVLSGKAPEADIKDYDLFYFNANDLSEAAEGEIQSRVDAVFCDLGVTIEASNQARVHVWYESFFGKPYEALRNSSEGIDRFLMPATCVGIKPSGVYAPHGLALMYDGLLTMNPLTPHIELFERKAASYCERWNWLKIDRSPYKD